LSGGQFTLSGTNGVPGWTYFVLTTADVSLPLAQWTPVQTNRFDSGGGFVYVGVVNPTTPQTFYAIQLSTN
jgi:hypothetical protein